MAVVLHIVKKPYEVNFSGNPIVYRFVLSPYRNIERRQDFRVQIRVEAEVGHYSNIFREIKSQVVFPDYEGSVSADISSIVDAYLSWHTPTPTMNILINAKKQYGRFRVTVVPIKDNQLMSDPISADVIHVIKGGMAYERFHYKNFFAEAILNDHKPLHFFTEKEMVSQDQLGFLYWVYPYDTQEKQYVKFSVEKADGTIIDQTSFLFITGVKWSVYISPLSFWGLAGLMPDHSYVGIMKKFTVSVVTETDVEVVAPITFYIDQKHHYNPATILFRNSAGALDSMRVLGEIENQAEYNSTNAELIPPPSGFENSILQPQIINASNEEIEKFSGNTNFISKTKMNVLRDLLLSRQCLEYKDEMLIPVLINKKTVKFYSNRVNLVGMAIEWQHAFSNNYYTPAGHIAANAACPAMESLEVFQLTKNRLQILWALPMPYDLVDITISNGVDPDIELTLSGNSGSLAVEFINPNPGSDVVTVKGRVICDADIYPNYVGPLTTVTLTVIANTPPIANDDTFSLEAGYTDPQVLSGTVLTNDYDPDDDPIEVVADSGPTTAGGTYDIDAAGVITYTAPSTLYNGQDSFTYTVQEVGNPSANDTATVRINVGNIFLGNAVYVKIEQRNLRPVNTTIAYTVYAAEVMLTYWADPACTIPRNIEGMGLSINIHHLVRTYEDGVLTDTQLDDTFAYTPVQIWNLPLTASLIFTGDVLVQFYLINNPGAIYKEVKNEFFVLPGTGYVPV